MRHKVTCASCGKTDRIEVEKGKPIPSGWIYFGKVCLNTRQTDKFYWTIKPDTDVADRKNWVKVKSKNYDAGVKRKYAEWWECSKCYKSPN